MTKKYTLTILLALILCVMAVGLAYGMEPQQRTIQAFRLLKNNGLIQALPASDAELAALDRFEKANIVAQAAERAASAIEAQKAQKAQGAPDAQGASMQPQPYPAAVLESLAWLESVFYEELMQLNKAPRFLALSGKAARDMNSGGMGNTAGAAGVQVPGQAKAETYSVYVNSSPVRTYQMIITEESTDAQAGTAGTGIEAGASPEAGTGNSTTINVPIMF